MRKLTSIFLMLAIVVTGYIALREYNRIRSITRDLQRLRTKVRALSDSIMVLQNTQDMLRIKAGLEPDTISLAQLGTGGGVEPSDPIQREAYNLEEDIDRLLALTRLELVSTETLVTIIERNKEKIDRMPTILPTHGYITSRYGYRTDPFTGKVKFHYGIDILAPIGTPIYAPAKGKVVSIRRRYGYGLTLKIDHGNGIITFYAHLHKTFVRVGDVVKRGDLIAEVGNTGRSTGPHLHYEVWNHGRKVNPSRYVIPEFAFYE